jgi:hypothetical protein
LCVPACNAGSCAAYPGTSCLLTENACLPNGSFPGSDCATGDVCSDTPPMACVDGTCVATCNDAAPETGDDYCEAINAILTCSASAGGLCLPACPGGNCDLFPGTSCLVKENENACLPNGSFPGSDCATGDVCSDTPIDMECVDGTCFATCDDGAGGDTFCAGISALLTCSVAAGGLCVPACDAGSCAAYPGTSCLLTENACLPNGSFPGSTCAAGDLCSQTPIPMVCITNTCLINCSSNAAICDAYGLVCDGTLLVCVEGGT